MESVNLDMDDIFDAGGDDDDVGAIAPMPGLDDEENEPMNPGGEGDEERGDEEGEEGDAAVLNRLKDISKGAAKKRVMKPQPKLNADRLKTPRGLPVLSKMFQEVKFKGKGYEVDDLKLMMGKLEHWGHRLFPKMTFDEFIDRLEKLGQKKDVQTCIKRLRLDMPILDEDFVEQTAESDEERAGGAENEDDEAVVMNAEEAYEEMIRQERELLQESGSLQNGDTVQNSVTASIEILPKNGLSSPPPSSQPEKATPGSLSEEQKERIERNKRIAMEKRMARLGQTPKGIQDIHNAASSPNTASSLISASNQNKSTPITAAQRITIGSLPEAPKPQDKLEISSESKNNEASRLSGDKEIGDQCTEDELLAALEDEDLQDIPDALSCVSSQHSNLSTPPKSRLDTPTKPRNTPSLVSERENENFTPSNRTLYEIIEEEEGCIEEDPLKKQAPESLRLHLSQTQSSEDSENIQLKLTESEEISQSDKLPMEQSDTLILELEDSEEASIKTCHSSSQNLKLKLSESEEILQKTEKLSTDSTDLNLHLAETDKGSAEDSEMSSPVKEPKLSNTESESELRLNLSVSDTEGLDSSVVLSDSQYDETL